MAPDQAVNFEIAMDSANKCQAFVITGANIHLANLNINLPLAGSCSMASSDPSMLSSFVPVLVYGSGTLIFHHISSNSPVTTILCIGTVANPSVVANLDVNNVTMNSDLSLVPLFTQIGADGPYPIILLNVQILNTTVFTCADNAYSVLLVRDNSNLPQQLPSMNCVRDVAKIYSGINNVFTFFCDPVTVIGRTDCQDHSNRQTILWALVISFSLIGLLMLSCQAYQKGRTLAHQGLAGQGIDSLKKKDQ